MARPQKMKSESYMLNAVEVENKYKRLYFFSQFSERGQLRYKNSKKKKQAEAKEPVPPLNKPDVDISHIGGNEHGVTGWNLAEQGDKPNLWESMRNMVLNHRLTDLKIRIGKLMFNCHRMVLQCYSKFFWDSGTEPLIELPESKITVKGFLMVYDWMLADKPKLQPDNVLELLQAAHFLGIDELYRQVWACLDNDLILREDVAFRFYQQAKSFEMKLLYEMFMTRVCKFFLPLMASEAYLKLDVNGLCMLLGSSAIGVNSEIEVFLSAIRWLNHDWKERQKHTEQVVACVRFSLMPLWYLVTLGQSLKCPKTQRVIETGSVKEQISNSIAYSATMDTRRMTSSDYVDFARTFGLEIPDERQWLIHPKCQYHHSLLCGKLEIVSFDVFRKGLKKFADLSEAEWKEFQFITEHDQRCQNRRCRGGALIQRAHGYEQNTQSEFSDYSTDATMPDSDRSGQFHHGGRHKRYPDQFPRQLLNARFKLQPGMRGRMGQRRSLQMHQQERRQHYRESRARSFEETEKSQETRKVEPIQVETQSKQVQTNQEQCIQPQVPAQSQQAPLVEGIQTQTQPQTQQQNQLNQTTQTQQESINQAYNLNQSQQIQPQQLQGQQLNMQPQQFDMQPHQINAQQQPMQPPLLAQPQQPLSPVHLQNQHQPQVSTQTPQVALQPVTPQLAQSIVQPQQFEPSLQTLENPYEEPEHSADVNHRMPHFHHPQYTGPRMYPHRCPGWSYPHSCCMGYTTMDPGYVNSSPPSSSWNAPHRQSFPRRGRQYNNSRFDSNEMNVQQRERSPGPAGESLSILTLESSQEDNTVRKRSQSVQTHKHRTLEVVFRRGRKQSVQTVQVAKSVNRRDLDKAEVRLKGAIEEQESREDRPSGSNANNAIINRKRSASDGDRWYAALKQTGNCLQSQSSEEPLGKDLIECMTARKALKGSSNTTQDQSVNSEDMIAECSRQIERADLIPAERRELIELKSPKRELTTLPDTSAPQGDGGPLDWKLKRLDKPRCSSSIVLSESETDELEDDVRRTVFEAGNNLQRSYGKSQKKLMPPLYRKLSLMEIPQENRSPTASANDKDAGSSHNGDKKSEEKSEPAKTSNGKSEREKDDDQSDHTVVGPLKKLDIGAMTIYSFGGNNPYDKPDIFNNPTTSKKAKTKDSDDAKQKTPRTCKFGDQVFYIRSNFDNWQHLTYIPFGMRNHYCAVKCNGRIYVIGGTRTTFDYEEHMSEKYEKSVWRFHPITGKWTCETNLPEPRRDFAVVVLDKTYSGDCESKYRFKDTHGFFVIAGEGVHGVLDSVLFYDVTKKSWTQMASLNHPRLGFMATLQNNEIWVAGGCRYASNTDITLISDTMEAYSLICQCQGVPANKSQGDSSKKCSCDKWRVLEVRLRIPRVFGRLCTVSKYEVYVIGGMTNKKANEWVSIGDVDVFDFIKKTWYHCADLCLERHNHDVALIDQDILVVGGISSVKQRVFREVELLNTKRRRSNFVAPFLPIPLTGMCIVCMDILESVDDCEQASSS